MERIEAGEVNGCSSAHRAHLRVKSCLDSLVGHFEWITSAQRTQWVFRRINIDVKRVQRVESTYQKLSSAVRPTWGIILALWNPQKTLGVGERKLKRFERERISSEDSYANAVSSLRIDTRFELYLLGQFRHIAAVKLRIYWQASEVERIGSWLSFFSYHSRSHSWVQRSFLLRKGWATWV